MKKLAYIYDHVFHEYNGLIYSSGAFSADTWRRFNAWEKIRVFAFINPVDSIIGLNCVSLSKIEFVNIHRPTLSIRHFVLAKSILKSTVVDKILECDHVVLRVPGEASLKIASILYGAGKPYGLEVVGCPWDAYWHQGLKGQLLAYSRFRLMKFVVSNASAVVYVSSEFLQKRYPTYALNEAISNVELDSYNSHNRLELPEGILNISHIGNYDVKYKGHMVLIRAISELPRALQRNIQIYFIGSGSNYSLKKLIRKHDINANITFTGKLKLGDEVYKYLNSSDIYIQTSYQEGLPRSVIEAMNARCFVIASSSGGTFELIQERFLYKPGNYKKLAELLLLYLQMSDDEKQNICLIQSKFVESKFDKNKLKNERNRFWSKYSLLR